MEDPKHYIMNCTLPSGSDNERVLGCGWKYTISNISQYKGLLVVGIIKIWMVCERRNLWIISGDHPAVSQILHLTTALI